MTRFSRTITTTLTIAILATAVLAAAPAAQAQNLGPPTPPPVIGVNPPPPPPPPPPAQQIKVFVANNGQTSGPFNAEQIKQQIAAGQLNRQTLVWMEGMTDWQAAAMVPAVAPLLTTAPPPAKFDAAAYLVGTWEFRTTTAIPGQGPAEIAASQTYRSDGTMSGFGNLTSQTPYGPFVMTMTSQGTWTAEAKTDNSFVLTPNVQVTSSSDYGAPSTQQNTTPALLTVIDRNTMSGADGLRFYRVGG